MRSVPGLRRLSGVRRLDESLRQRPHDRHDRHQDRRRELAGASELRLVVTNAGDNIDSDHGDWALARIECGAARHHPAHGRGHDPCQGASGVAGGVSPTATFSEAMDPASLTTSTFTLTKQGQIDPGRGERLLSRVRSRPSTRTRTWRRARATRRRSRAARQGRRTSPETRSLPTSAGASRRRATNQPPSPVIDTPASTLTWKVGDPSPSPAMQRDPEQGTLPASALSWTLLMQHCPSNCHAHTIQSWPGVAGGSFSAPDHEYPSYLELKLTRPTPGV